jgi:hypothetical protein
MAINDILPVIFLQIRYEERQKNMLDREKIVASLQDKRDFRRKVKAYQVLKWEKINMSRPVKKRKENTGFFSQMDLLFLLLLNHANTQISK